MVRSGAQLTGLTLCAAGAVLCAQRASAAEWQVAPSLNVGTSYADNPRLFTHDETSSSGAIGELNAGLRRLTDRSELFLRPRLVSSRYSDDESLDSDDQYLTAGYNRQGERSEWNTELGLTRDTTLTSELGTTGLVQSNRRHQAVSFTVAPKVMFTERVSGGLQMSLIDNRYIDAESTGLVDYTYKALALYCTIALTDAGSSLTVTAQGGELASPGYLQAATETRDASLRLGWSFQPWALWTASLSGGPSMVETDRNDDRGFVMDSELKRSGERWSLAASAGRSQSPTGRGLLSRRDEVRLNFTRDLTERLSGSIAARWVRSEDMLPQQGRPATYYVDYTRLDLGASWRMSRSWSLSLQLTANSQDYELAQERADGYRASLSFVWNGQPQSL
jgi:hypothetical protein